MSEEKLAINELHRRMAINTNNEIWLVLDKVNPTKDELEQTLHMAHTSLYHWSKIGEKINIARADYMIYSALSWSEPALHHAQKCLEITQETEIGDFDLAFAYEVMARAYKTAGKNTECKKYRNLALKAIRDIKREEDKTICQAELDEVKCD